MTENLATDITTYKLSQHLGDESIFAGYVAGNYDASADYWKLMKNGDLVDDDDGWLRDENGNFILDNDGNKIGDSGKETGLLNILFGKMNGDGTVSYLGKKYDSFSDEEIKVAQALMLSAGMKNDGAENFRDVRWISEENGNHVISAKEILSEAGNTVATPVFMNALDKASDTVVFEPYLSINVISSMNYSYRNRFLDFVQVKEDFYFGEHALFSDKDLNKMRISGEFSPDKAYQDGQHKGIDFASKLDTVGSRLYDLTGTDILSFYSGRVVKNYQSESAGNSIIIEHGFNFENMFYSVGVQSQYMHLIEESPILTGSYVSKDTIIGKLGSTGMSTGPHLHYQLMGNLVGVPATSKQWNMLADRRNKFLNNSGVASVKNWTYENTKTQNYYASHNDYQNFYYNRF